MRALVFSGVVVIATLLAEPISATAQQSGDFTYLTNASGITITKYTGSATGVIIPDTIDGLPVTIIETNAFRSGTLTSVIVGSNVTAIRSDAFRSCIALTNVTFGSALASIGVGAFSFCSELADIRLPTNLNSIANLAFANCSKLSSIIIPASVTNIGNAVFVRCSNLTSIAVDSQNLFFSSADGVLFDKNQKILRQYPNGIAGDYSIPNGVTTIGNSAFHYCEQLTVLTIPENLTNIALQALADCPRLTGIHVDTNNPVFASLDGVVFNKDVTALIVCPGGRSGSYAIPDTVTTIEDYGLYKCNGLTNILIPNGVAAIGNAAFFGCGGVTDLALPSTVRSIENAAFGSSGLRSVTLPNGITNIASSLFFACRQLTNIVIPDSVTSIGSGAFQGCDSLLNIVIPASVRTIESAVFFALRNLQGAYFGGDAPGLRSPFGGANNLTIYYLPGTAGWTSTFGGRPTALWQPEVLAGDAGFGVQTNGFGFAITWASGRLIVVEASTNLADPVWTAVATNTLGSSISSFSDPNWTNHPAVFYRIRSP